MKPHDTEPDIAQDDRRSRARKDLGGGVTIRIDDTSISARAENRSATGMYLVLDGPLELEVTVDGCTQSARLVRVSALPGDRSGWGVELRPSDLATNE